MTLEELTDRLIKRYVKDLSKMDAYKIQAEDLERSIAKSTFNWLDYSDLYDRLCRGKFFPTIEDAEQAIRDINWTDDHKDTIDYKYHTNCPACKGHRGYYNEQENVFYPGCTTCNNTGRQILLEVPAGWTVNKEGYCYLPATTEQKEEFWSQLELLARKVKI